MIIFYPDTTIGRKRAFCKGLTIRVQKIINTSICDAIFLKN